MKTFWSLVQRNIKLFFKDRALFFVAMISPVVLLVLFVTFLGSTYKNTFLNIISEFGASVQDGVIDGAVVAYLFSALLSVSCVTVAFCCNVMSIQDKINGVKNDFEVTPVKKTTVAFSYLVATFIVSMIICLIIFAILLIMTFAMGQFYFNFSDICFSLLIIAALCLFGAILSSIVCHFCSTQSQLGAITGIVSSCYGFLCGAYMPISQFSSGISNFISILPGTFGTSLLKNRLLSGYLAEMSSEGVPGGALDAIRHGFDLKLSFSGNEISINLMTIVLAVTIIISLALFVILNKVSLKHKR